MCFKTSLKLYFCSSTLLRFYHSQNTHTRKPPPFKYSQIKFSPLFLVAFFLVFNAKKNDGKKNISETLPCVLIISTIHPSLSFIVSSAPHSLPPLVPFPFTQLSLDFAMYIVTISILHQYTSTLAQTRIENEYLLHTFDRAESLKTPHRRRLPPQQTSSLDCRIVE